MEYGLGQIFAQAWRRQLFFVLILLLMEYGLGYMGKTVAGPFLTQS